MRCDANYFYRMILERCLRILQGWLQRVLDRMRLQIELEHPGIELRHLRGLADQSVQAVGLFVDDGQQFASSLIVESGAGQQGRNAGLDGRQRSAELVRHGIEQSGSQALMFLLGAVLAEGFKGASALDCQARQASQRIESFARQLVSRDA